MVRTFIALNDHRIKVGNDIVLIKKGDTFHGQYGNGRNFVEFEHFICYTHEGTSIVSNPFLVDRGIRGQFRQLSKKEARAQYRDNSKNRSSIKGKGKRPMLKTIREVMQNMRLNHDRYIASLNGKCYYCQDPSPSSDCIYYDRDHNSWFERRLASRMDVTGNITDMFANVRIEVKPVTRCPVCKRVLPENGDSE